MEGWRFTLQEPSVIPTLTYLDDAEIREQVWRAYNTRASRDEHDNRERLVEVLDLRRRKAELLGYASFVDLVLEDRMAGKAARAASSSRTSSSAPRTSSRGRPPSCWPFARELEGPEAPELSPWTSATTPRRCGRARYDFDEEQLRPYFPVDKVMSGMFELVGRLYGIEVRKVDGFETWHESVETYEVVDDDRQLGVVLRRPEAAGDQARRGVDVTG